MQALEYLSFFAGHIIVVSPFPKGVLGYSHSMVAPTLANARKSRYETYATCALNPRSAQIQLVVINGCIDMHMLEKICKTWYVRP